MSLYALVDCNNFFASCERIFNPKLANQPVVVLSNNDGCVVARSNEAKALGIGMGEPYFKCEALLKKHKVHVYSANFVLYGDISNRVMTTLLHCVPDMEIYSIDEAFLYLDGFGENPYEYVRAIRQKVKRDIGMPVSIGVSLTKTLAKAANLIAKKHNTEGVFCLTDPVLIDNWLAKIPVEEIWGIGRNKAAFLHSYGILNALQLKNAPDAWIKKNLTVISLKTVMELRGMPCLELEETLEKKAITTSRSFSEEVRTLADLEEAVASYISTAAEKLRRQQSVCGYVQVYIQTNRFHKDRYYSNSAGIDITPPSAYTPQLIHAAHQLTKKIFRHGYGYKKAGVILSNLKDASQGQEDLFNETYHNSRQERLMRVIDGFNHKTNSGKIFLAAEGVEQPWYMKQTRKSARFTTRWDEIPQVH